MGRLLAVFPLFTLLVSLNTQSANSQLPSFSELAEASSPAVVNISSSKTVKSRGYGSRGFNNDPFYDDFFKRFFGKFFIYGLTSVRFVLILNFRTFITVHTPYTFSEK